MHACAYLPYHVERCLETVDEILKIDSDFFLGRWIKLVAFNLQGRFAEAETIAQADLPSDKAAANVAYLRKMLAQQNGWNTTAQRTTDQSGNAPGRPGS